jgi:hypothetical protein
LACIRTLFFTCITYVAKAVKQQLLTLGFKRLRGDETTGLYCAQNICPEGCFLVPKVFGFAYNGSNMKVMPCGRQKRYVWFPTIDAMIQWIGAAGEFMDGVQGLTYVDSDGNIYCFIPVVELEHTWRPAHIRPRDGRKFTQESFCKMTFSRAFISSITGDVNIPLYWSTNKMVVLHFKPTPLKLALLKLHIFLLVADRTPRVFSAALITAKSGLYLAAISALLPAQLDHEIRYYEEVMDELPLAAPRYSHSSPGSTLPAYLAANLQMGTLALLQEADRVVLVKLLTTRPPSLFIGPIDDGDRCPIEEWPVPRETVSVHEYHAGQLHGVWVPTWEILNSGSKTPEGDVKPGREGFNKFQNSKTKPGVNAIVPERWVFPESLAMLDVTLTLGGRLPAAVVREFTAHEPALPIW